MERGQYEMVSRSDMEPMMTEGSQVKHAFCSRKGLFLSIFMCAVCLSSGVVIGWFSHRAVPQKVPPDPVGQRFDSTDFILKNLNKDNIRKNLQDYTKDTRLPGSQLDFELAQTILTQWRAAGIDEAHLATYQILISFPNVTHPNMVQILNSQSQPEFTSALREKPLTAAENKSQIVPPYNAFSPAGVAVGDLVYVNYGRVEDFDYLTRNLSFNLTGKILIARYGKIFRGDKLELAGQYQAAGLILYNDPADFNSDPNADPYPHSWWLPPSGLQRGTVGGDGDYQTPLYPSTNYAYRIPVSKLNNLPSVPTQPIGYGDAEKLLRQMKGNLVPPEWKGGLDIQYRLGPGFTNSSLKTRVVVNNYLTVRPAYNVIGYVRGDVEPDRYVLMGNHHDAWAFGAIDPLSGSAALTDIVRVFGKMLQQGHRPRRTIVFCSWDMEEPALKGSTEYVEDKMKVLYERAVAYLNVDYAVDYPYTIVAETSPLLQDPMYAAAKKVPSPEKDGRTLYELWRTRPLNSATPPPAEPELKYGLGADSDYAAFYQRAGVPSVDVWFTYDEHRFSAISYPLYHSAYDTFYEYVNFIDPNFNYTLAMGQFWAVLASDLANAELLNMNVTRYASALRIFVDSILQQFKDIWKEKGINAGAFNSSVENFTRSANDFAARLKDVDLAKYPPLKLRMLNDQIMQLERAFIDPEGLPNQPVHKHIVFAPSQFDAYASNKFPGIADTMFDLQQNKTSDWDLLRRQVYIATYMVQSAANTLSGIGL